MRPLFDVVVPAMALGRVGLGLAPFVAAAATSRLLGFPAAHDSPTARLMGRLFGVRDIGLGVLAFYALQHREAASFLFLFNAATDAADLVAIGIPLARREGIDRGAVASGLCAIVGGLSWVTVWALTRVG
jgi:hypothetical protein